MAKKKKNNDRRKSPVPTGHDFRGRERKGPCTGCCGGCKTPDGISGDWGE